MRVLPLLLLCVVVARADRAAQVSADGTVRYLQGPKDKGPPTDKGQPQLSSPDKSLTPSSQDKGKTLKLPNGPLPPPPSPPDKGQGSPDKDPLTKKGPPPKAPNECPAFHQGSGIDTSNCGAPVCPCARTLWTVDAPTPQSGWNEGDEQTGSGGHLRGLQLETAGEGLIVNEGDDEQDVQQESLRKLQSVKPLTWHGG